MRFYCEVDSDSGKKATTRGGHKTMSVHARGWNLGVRIELVRLKNGEDRIIVKKTGGSHGQEQQEVIATLESEAVLAR